MTSAISVATILVIEALMDAPILPAVATTAEIPAQYGEFSPIHRESPTAAMVATPALIANSIESRGGTLTNFICVVVEGVDG